MIGDQQKYEHRKKVIERLQRIEQLAQQYALTGVLPQTVDNEIINKHRWKAMLRSIIVNGGRPRMFWEHKRWA